MRPRFAIGCYASYGRAPAVAEYGDRPHLSALRNRSCAASPVTFRGFIANSSFDLRIVDCGGRVHIDHLKTNTSATSIWPATSNEGLRSDAVTLHDVATHGSPAVSATDSVVAI
ncbi:MAG: hypothetical protein ACJAYX_002418 [Planctomycetota bacterium]